MKEDAMCERRGVECTRSGSGEKRSETRFKHAHSPKHRRRALIIHSGFFGGLQHAKRDESAETERGPKMSAGRNQAPRCDHCGKKGSVQIRWM